MPRLSRCWVTDLSSVNERIACHWAWYMSAATPARALLFPRALRANVPRRPPGAGHARAWRLAHEPGRRSAVTADARATAHEWAEPGVYPVAPGVHRVPLPLPTDGLRAVNVYVIEDDGGLVLIDSGWALEVARRALTSALATLGAG